MNEYRPMHYCGCRRFPAKTLGCLLGIGFATSIAVSTTSGQQPSFILDQLIDLQQDNLDQDQDNQSAPSSNGDETAAAGKLLNAPSAIPTAASSPGSLILQSFDGGRRAADTAAGSAGRAPSNKGVAAGRDNDRSRGRAWIALGLAGLVILAMVGVRWRVQARKRPVDYPYSYEDDDPQRRPRRYRRKGLAHRLRSRFARRRSVDFPAMDIKLVERRRRR